MSGSAFIQGPSPVDSERPPKVSVITIFRNEERFLQEAIESVLAQTCTDWELLLVDDGSTDGSSALAKEHAMRRPGQVRYFEHPGHENRGMSASRNVGLGRAQGEYVAFLDGDDVFFPERLERHVEVLESLPEVAMVQSDVIHWLSWQSSHIRSEDDYVRPCVCFTDRVLRAPLGLWTVVAVPELYPGICSLTVRRSVAVQLGGFEPRFRSLYEDQVFLTKVYAEKTVYVMEDYLAGYRIHDRSTVQQLAGTAHRVDGAWQMQRREFELWRSVYLRSRPDPTGLLARIAEEGEARQDAGPGSRFQLMLSAVRGYTKRALEASLPRPAYRHLLMRRRRLANRQTLARYQRLCRRMALAAENGR